MFSGCRLATLSLSGARGQQWPARGPQHSTPPTAVRRAAGLRMASSLLLRPQSRQVLLLPGPSLEPRSPSQIRVLAHVGPAVMLFILLIFTLSFSLTVDLAQILGRCLIESTEDVTEEELRLRGASTRHVSTPRSCPSRRPGSRGLVPPSRPQAPPTGKAQ